MSKKEEQYLNLVRRISQCKKCEDLATRDKQNSGLDNRAKDSGVINLWNCWQGSLDAKIIVMGQDYGCYPERKESRKRCYNIETCKSGKAWILNEDEKRISDSKSAKKYWGATDANLWILFCKVFGVDIAVKRDSLFFTNMACCYRKPKEKTSGSINSCWLPYCSSYFMGELLGIIKPKAIIALGKPVLDALKYCKDSKFICQENSNVDATMSDKYSNLIAFDYFLQLPEVDKIRVFPVYHPGAYSTVNRPMTGKYPEDKDCQVADWMKIKKWLEDRNIKL